MLYSKYRGRIFAAAANPPQKMGGFAAQMLQLIRYYIIYSLTNCGTRFISIYYLSPEASLLINFI
jgi:hypothetical protein